MGSNLHSSLLNLLSLETGGYITLLKEVMVASTPSQDRNNQENNNNNNNNNNNHHRHHHHEVVGSCRRKYLQIVKRT